MTKFAKRVPRQVRETLIAFGFGIPVAIGVSACTVGPHYAAPSSTLDNFHNGAAAAERETTLPAPPLESWWEGFQDPTLTRIIQQALAQNLDLAESLARVAQARAAAREAGARLLPTLDGTDQLTSLHQSLESPIGEIGQHLPGFPRNVTFYDVGASASWEVDLFGGVRRGVEAATAEAQAAEADRTGVRISVAGDVADAYIQIRGIQEQLRLAEEQIETDSRLLELVHHRLDNGLGSDREEAQAEALVAQARATVPPLRRVLEVQINRLDVLLGIQPGASIRDIATPAPIPVAPAVPAHMTPADMLRHRPDIIAAERRLVAATARIGVATSEYYPKISLSGLLGFESANVSDLFKSATFQPEAVAGLRWRLFDFGKVDAEVAQANAATAVALAQYRRSVLRAAEDVEDAFMSLVQREAQSRALTQAVAALERARKTSEQNYQAGAVDLTDVLDADRQLLVAQDDLACARADAGRAAVASFRALGGAW